MVSIVYVKVVETQRPKILNFVLQEFINRYKGGELHGCRKFLL